MTEVEQAILAAARQYAETLKQTWGDNADYVALRQAESRLVMAAGNLVPDEEWKALRRAKYGTDE